MLLYMAQSIVILLLLLCRPVYWRVLGHGTEEKGVQKLYMYSRFSISIVFEELCAAEYTVHGISHDSTVYIPIYFIV